MRVRYGSRDAGREEARVLAVGVNLLADDDKQWWKEVEVAAVLGAEVKCVYADLVTVTVAYSVCVEQL